METKRNGRGRPKGEGSAAVYQSLRSRILNAELRPGTDLNEPDLVEEYGVSRTPVREALIKLASDALVEIVPNRGARIAPIDVTEIPALFEALELAERAINRFCALRHTSAQLTQIEQSNQAFERASFGQDYGRMADENLRFHGAIAASCGNRYLGDHYVTLANMAMRLSRLGFENTEGRKVNDEYYGTVRQHHRDIIEAIRAGDADAADELARRHQKLFRQRLMLYLRRNNASDISIK
ncbi:GntR family transcriptional regulator [Mesorhizobium sp. M1227]|uniref:GntR family transcriptional regulator n=1 Tax=Mesorhizobium sp. M1227 TaxID=2957071 RepID=UPI00333AAE0B